MTQKSYKVSGREGVLSMIPVILGFHPTDSVVLIILTPGGRQIGPIMRVDLTEYWKDADELAELLASTAIQHGDSCIVVFYGLEVDPFGFDGMLADYQMLVEEIFFTDNTPHELDTTLHAEHVGVGRVVGDDRDAVRARVEFFAAAEPDDSDRALLVAMADSAARDEYLAANMPAAAAVLPHILATCRRVTDPAPGASPAKIRMVANLCVVAGVLAYRTGDGTLTQVCLDRAMRIDPTHQLAWLMRKLMALGSPPAALDGLVEAST